MDKSSILRSGRDIGGVFLATRHISALFPDPWAGILGEVEEGDVMLS